MEDDLWRMMTIDGRRPLTKDNLWMNVNFDGRWPLMEDDLWRKTTFDKRQPLKEGKLWRKTNFDRRRPLTKDNLWRKATSDRRKTLLKTTFDGGRPSVGCIVYYLKKTVYDSSTWQQQHKTMTLDGDCPTITPWMVLHFWAELSNMGGMGPPQRVCTPHQGLPPPLPKILSTPLLKILSPPLWKCFSVL